MRNIIRATIYASVGFVDKLREEIDELVKRGELKQQEGQELVAFAEEESRSRVRDLQAKVESAVRTAVEKIPIVSLRKEVTSLEARIAELEARLKTIPAASEEPVEVLPD